MKIIYIMNIFASYEYTGCLKIDTTQNNTIMIYFWDKCNGGHLEHVL